MQLPHKTPEGNSSSSTIYDLIIIGGGPAGAAGAVYAGRKQLNTLLITESFGGQSFVSDQIENWIGEVAISGMELAQKLENHVKVQETVEVKMPEKVVEVKELEGRRWEVTTDKGSRYKTRAVLVASGGRRRKLNVPGEKEFEGRGVAYCSTCDAPLFRGKTVALVGAGNAGAEGVVDLLPYAKKVYWLVRNEITADPATIEKIKARSDLVEIVSGVEVAEVLGEKVVSRVRLKRSGRGDIAPVKALGGARSRAHSFGVAFAPSTSVELSSEPAMSTPPSWGSPKSGAATAEPRPSHTLDVDGLFIEIGSIPNSEFMQGVVDMNKRGEIVIDHKYCSTSVPGIFAAGDVTDEPYKQNNISVGQAVAAALSAYNYLHGRDRSTVD